MGASPTLRVVSSPLGRFAEQIACWAMDGPNLERFFVETSVYLLPDAPLEPALLAGIPIAFALGCDAGAVHCPALHHAMMSREEIKRVRGPLP